MRPFFGPAIGLMGAGRGPEVQLTPTMTADISGDYVAFASGYLEDDKRAYKAFDNNDSTRWLQLGPPANGLYVGVMWSATTGSKAISRYQLSCDTAHLNMPPSWIIQALVNGSWTTIDSSSHTWVDGDVLGRTLPNIVENVLGIRLVFTSDTFDHAAIPSLRFWGYN